MQDLRHGHLSLSTGIFIYLRTTKDLRGTVRACEGLSVPRILPNVSLFLYFTHTVIIESLGLQENKHMRYI